MNRTLCFTCALVVGLQCLLSSVASAAPVEFRNRGRDLPPVPAQCGQVAAYGRQVQAVWAKLAVDDPQLADSTANDHLDALNVVMFAYAVTNAKTELTQIQPPSYATAYHQALIAVWAVYVATANDAQNGHVSLTFALLLHANDHAAASARLKAAKTAAAQVCSVFPAYLPNDF